MLRLRQGLVIALGLVAAGVMLWLGLWQLQVFTDQGNRSAELRAQQPAVPLLDQVGRDGAVGDIYGKPVIADGRYLPDRQQRVVGADGVVRLLAALQLPDGRVLPVVRGVLADGRPAPAEPSGPVRQVGVFLPSEPGRDGTLPADVRLGSVRLPLLAQLWPEPLLPGFITLDPAEAARQGLAAAPVTLPSADGSWRNSAYALQWWVFAAFAIGMAVRIAISFGRDAHGGDAAGAAVDAGTDRPRPDTG